MSAAAGQQLAATHKQLEQAREALLDAAVTDIDHDVAWDLAAYEEVQT